MFIKKLQALFARYNITKAKALAIFTMLLLIIVATPLTIIQLQKEQDIRQRASDEFISFQLGGGPASGSSIAINEPISFNVVLQQATPQRDIAAVDIEIEYTADTLDVQSFSPNNSLLGTIKSETTAGKIKYVGANINTGAKIEQQTILLGSVTFRPKATGNAQIRFTKTQAAAIGIDQTFLTVDPLNLPYTYIILSASQPTAIPTITPTETIAPTAPPATPVACEINADCDIKNIPQCKTSVICSNSICQYYGADFGASCTTLDNKNGTCSNIGVCAISAPTNTPIPTRTPTPTLTPVPTPPGSGGACSCTSPICNNGICQCGYGQPVVCLGGQHCEYPQGSPSLAVCKVDPTAIPTQAAVATPTLVPTSVPVTGGTTLVFNSIKLDGITDASVKKKTANIYIRQVGSNSILEPGTMTYQLSSAANANLPAIFTGSVNLPASFPPGYYTVSTNNTLRKLIGLISPTGTNINFPQIALSLGDVTSGNSTTDFEPDNKIDIFDFAVIRDCFGNKSGSTECKGHPAKAIAAADLNGDNIISGLDYNIFIKNIGVREGD